MDTAPIRVTLETELTKLTRELAAIAVYDRATDNWEALPVGTESPEPDETDEADVVEEWNERRATVSVLEIEYHNVKRALSKIDNGTYGICEVSGEPIEEERLLANPTARTCIAHREEEDILSL
jgi:RNA polymerase-binding transcription factor DksA